MAEYMIQDTTLTDMANAVRNMRGETGTLTPAQMIQKINQTNPGDPIDINILNENHINPATGKWVRPNEYPDLDSIELPENFDGVYMTYDLRKTPGYAWIGVHAILENSSQYYVDRGHILNGSFVVDETHTVNSNAYFRQNLDSENGDIQIWRMTPVNTARHFTQFGFTTNTDNSTTSTCNQLQPCVERVGYMDYIVPMYGDTGNSSSYKKHCTMWMERDGLVAARKVAITAFSGIWSAAYSLQQIDFEKWDTSLWKINQIRSPFSGCVNLREINIGNWDTSSWSVTRLDYAFFNCFSLRELDLSKWDTSNWAVTNFNYTFGSCYSLRSLKISTWDTSNWAVTNMASTWMNCPSLMELDLSTWDTSHWAVTSLAQTFYKCSALKYIGIEGWVTSNWKVTSLYCTWAYDYSLLSLDLSGWDTSGWSPTTMASAWNGCQILQKLDISTWDTSNWALVTTGFESVWNNCNALAELDISNLDTSNWTITSLGNTFGNCRSITELDIDEWDTSKWGITSLSGTFSNCLSLQSLNLNDWDTSNWNVTTMYYFCYWCHNLKELLIGDWDTSNWHLTNMGYILNACTAIHEFDISKWDTTNFAVADTRSWFGGCYNLETVSLPNLPMTSAANVSGSLSLYNLTNFTGMAIPNNHTYAEAYKLTHQSLLNIVNKLPTVTGTKTITLYAYNQHKLTAAEIAIATQKGWTVA